MPSPSWETQVVGPHRSFAAQYVVALSTTTDFVNGLIGHRNYLAWTNSYQKALMRLGIAAEPEHDATPNELSEYISALAEVAAERRSVAA